jgi:hypothetical protein
MELLLPLLQKKDVKDVKERTQKIILKTKLIVRESSLMK